MFYCTPWRFLGCPARTELVPLLMSDPWRIIQYGRTASRRAIATLAVLRPRRITRWRYWLGHSGMLRTVTCAASTVARPRAQSDDEHGGPNSERAKEQAFGVS